MITIDQLNTEIIKIEQEINKTQEDQKANEKELKLAERNVISCEEAIEIISAVLSITQESILEFIKRIVTTALQYVYDETYEFHMEVIMRRNQPELVIAPVKDGLILNPKYGCGVGVLDVCAFALRYAFWALEEPRSSAIMIHDEPFKSVHGKEENRRLGEMVSKLSEMLGIQIIIISGESVLTEYADKAFKVSLEKDISKIVEV